MSFQCFSNDSQIYFSFPADIFTLYYYYRDIFTEIPVFGNVTVEWR